MNIADYGFLISLGLILVIVLPFIYFGTISGQNQNYKDSIEELSCDKLSILFFKELSNNSRFSNFVLDEFTSDNCIFMVKKID